MWHRLQLFELHAFSCIDLDLDDPDVGMVASVVPSGLSRKRSNCAALALRCAARELPQPGQSLSACFRAAGVITAISALGRERPVGVRTRMTGVDSLRDTR